MKKTKKTTTETAVTDALEAYQDRLYSVIYMMMVTHEQDVMDVLQNTNVAVMTHLAEYDPSKPVWPWLRGIAVNETLHWHRARRQSHVDFNSELVDKMAETVQDDRFARRTDSADYLAALERCMAKLPPVKRDLLRERYSTNEKVEEIARRFSLSTNSFSSLLSKLRRALRQCVEKTVSAMRRGDKLPNIAFSFDDTLDRFFDGSCAEEESEALQTQLLASPEMLEEFLFQAYTHAFINCHRRQLFGEKRIAGKPVFRVYARSAAIAAALALLLAGGTAIFRHPSLEKKPDFRRGLSMVVDSGRRPKKIAEAAARETRPSSTAFPSPALIAPLRNALRASSQNPLSTGTAKTATPRSPVADETTKGENMNRKSTVPAVVAAAGLVALGASAPAAAGATGSTTFFLNETRCWQTAYTNQIPICWKWGPTNATKAAFSLTGMNAADTRTYSKADGDKVYTLPALTTAEDLYTVTLSYQDTNGNTLSAVTGVVASVFGAANSPEVNVPFLDLTSPATNKTPVAAWPRVKRPGIKADNVVIGYDTAWVTTNKADSALLTIAAKSGKKTTTNALKTAEGWFSWTVADKGWGNGWFSLTFTADGSALTACVFRPVYGTVISLR